MKIRFIFSGFLIVFLCSIMLISSKESGIKLTEGRNLVELNITDPFYVETLVKLNPDIEVVSYREENNTVGYVNIFNGIGKNFVMENREYEVIVSRNLSLILP